MADIRPPSPRRLLGGVWRKGRSGRGDWPGESPHAAGRPDTAERPPLKPLVVGLGLLMVVGAIAAGAMITVDSFARGSGPFAPAAPPTNITNGPGSAPSNASLGGTTAAFMQATQAETAVTVNSALFAAKFNQSNASERPQLIRTRIATLERRLETLKHDQAALRKATADA